MARGKFNAEHSANQGILAYLNDGSGGYGVHPDILDRMIDLAATVQGCGRQSLRGARLLVHRKTGVIVAVAFGTEYCIRVGNAAKEARRAGLRTTLRWTDGGSLNLNRTFGKGSVFGCWLEKEAEWIQVVVSGLAAEETTSETN